MKNIDKSANAMRADPEMTDVARPKGRRKMEYE